MFRSSLYHPPVRLLILSAYIEAQSLGLGSQWPAVKQAYIWANELCGDIIKVTPSSKVVGDFAQWMSVLCSRCLLTLLIVMPLQSLEQVYETRRPREG